MGRRPSTGRFRMCEYIFIDTLAKRRITAELEITAWLQTWLTDHSLSRIIRFKNSNL